MRVCGGGNRQANILLNNSAPSPGGSGGGGGGSRPLQPMNSLQMLSGQGGALPRLYRAEMSNKRGLREVTGGTRDGGRRGGARGMAGFGGGGGRDLGRQERNFCGGEGKIKAGSVENGE